MEIEFSRNRAKSKLFGFHTCGKWNLFSLPQRTEYIHVWQKGVCWTWWRFYAFLDK